MVTAEESPLHIMLPEVVAVDTSAGGSLTVTVVVTEQPFASITVYALVPADCVNVPVPVYAGVPPTAEMVTVEVPPLHITDVAPEPMNISDGSVSVTLTEEVQPFASVTR